MRAFASVLLPDPFGPMRAWISPLFTVSVSPLRIGLPSTAMWRLRISSVGLLIRSFRSLRHLDLDREALTASARLLRARVLELDAGPQETALVVDLRAGKHLEGAWVHIDREPLVFEHGVILLPLRGEAEKVAESGAAARLHPDAQRLPFLSFLGPGPLHVRHGRGGQGKSLLRLLVHEFSDERCSTMVRPGSVWNPATRAGSSFMP